MLRKTQGSSHELSWKVETHIHSPNLNFSVVPPLYMNQLVHIPNDDETYKMVNLRRLFTKKKDTVGNGRCKKHPKHRQSPGVCSLCLREKLSQLSASSSRRTTSAVTADSSSSSSSLSSYYSSSSASSCASPMHRFRFTTEGKSRSSSVSIFLLSGKHGIIKSRSMAVVPRRRDREGGVDHGHNNKSANKSGFWFKLLHPKNKRMEEKDAKLVRSLSIRETVTVTSRK